MQRANVNAGRKIVLIYFKAVLKICYQSMFQNNCKFCFVGSEHKYTYMYYFSWQVPVSYKNTIYMLTRYKNAFRN